MDVWLKDKVAVLTGASSGLGKAIALALAGEEAAILVSYRGDREKAEEVAGQIKGAGGKAVTVRADVAEPEDVRASVQDAVGSSVTWTSW